MARITIFDREFDGTDMTLEQIEAEVRLRGWSGMRIDTHRAFCGDGKLMIRRLSKRRAKRAGRVL
jgi:hypothetical protein